MTTTAALLHVGPYAFTETDAKRTFGNLGELWRMHVHGLPVVPDAAVDVAHEIGERLAARTGVATGDGTGGPGPLLDDAGRAAATRIGPDGWPPSEAELELDAAWLGLRAVADALRGAGVYGPTTTGRVVQLNVSRGGVPKQPIERAVVGFGGVAGDRQATRVHHGRPWQALCLWGAEVVDAFAAAGHPIAYGNAGENVTVGGVPWERVRPGAHLRVGSVECEVSSYALPCSKNAGWFLDGVFDTMHHERGPVSRVYATVTAPGEIVAGDDVVLEP